ncbi:hypothetical protein AWB81_07014 [Caballeronia arationis]|uniref:hypothetical protein n=1 Tax=Caballeronia arationis TaxID=1777142 RepID=UPI00074BD02B|nr:hypothetical protein [Caballeronia arationis]SAL05093.1 hypothetical protein AWB81_07014 [Caballeronia arationis]
MRTRSYSMGAEDDGNADLGSGRSDVSQEGDFVFDGFKLTFSEKVTLTPVAPMAPAAPLTQAQSSRWH